MEYLKLHPDKTLKEIGQGFEASDASVFYKLRLHGITDKNLFIQGAGSRKAERIHEIPQQKANKRSFFVDESGINY
jgi:hypothetical protein